jgi:glutathione S-transferase
MQRIAGGSRHPSHRTGEVGLALIKRAVRSALPMNLKRHYPGFKIWTGALPDIERITAIWRECLTTYKGPYLFGRLSMADAMFAPDVARFLSYDVKLDEVCAAYCRQIMAWPDMVEWVKAAKAEPDELPELDAEF